MIGRRHQLCWLAVLASTAATAALGGPPAPAYTPRPVGANGQPETGYSTIEQRYAYAPPDEGSFEMDLRAGALPNEFAIEEENCREPDAMMHVKVTYSKSKNKVTFEAKFRELPYRPSFCYERNPTNAFNEYPDCVDEGRWQLWVITRLFTVDIIYWYDALTLDLLGSEWDFPDGPPPYSFPVVIPGVQCLCSPEFDPKPDGHGTFTWEYSYDHMLDANGNAGTQSGFVPKNLCSPDEYTAIYSNGGLPESQVMTFDEILKGIWNGSGFAMATSLEPQEKPDYLESRDNIMVGHLGFYPMQVPEGYTFNMLSQTIELKDPETCQTHQNTPWPGPYYDLCSVGP